MIKLLSGFLLLSAALFAAPGQALEIAKHEAIVRLVEELESKHQYPEAELKRIFARAKLQPRIIELISRPSESLPWHRYRKLFVTPVQVDSGVEFWRAHEATLARAERKFGIPAAIIVAIIGVETRYGRNRGSHSVLDALTTLTVQYPRRSKFFASELRHFLLLVREEQIDPLGITGSYAGAIGIPQFMPSSYRAYAVDFSGNGRRDLVNETEDAIGSVANYLRRYRWRADGPIAAETNGADAQARKLVTPKLRPNTTVAALRKAGIASVTPVDGATRAGLVRLQGEGRDLYRIAFDNFFVITRYNPSVLYAMAVYELSQAISERKVAS